MAASKPLTPEMDELSISEEAVNSAVIAMYGRLNTRVGEGSLALIQSEAGWPENARLAIRGFLQAEGFEVEHKYVKGEPLRVARLIGRWKPEQGTDSPSSSSGADADDQDGRRA